MYNHDLVVSFETKLFAFCNIVPNEGLACKSFQCFENCPNWGTRWQLILNCSKLVPNVGLRCNSIYCVILAVSTGDKINYRFSDIMTERGLRGVPFFGHGLN